MPENPNNSESITENVKDIYANRLIPSMHREIDRAKNILEGKYAQSPSDETSKKLDLYSELMRLQYEKFANEKNSLSRGEAVTEMRTLSNEMEDSLYRSPRMRILATVNRFDTTEVQAEVQTVQAARKWAKEVMQKGTEGATLPSGASIQMRYLLLKAKDASDHTIEISATDLSSHPDIAEMLRVALSPLEIDEFRETLSWHLKYRESLPEATKNDLKELLRSVW